MDQSKPLLRLFSPSWVSNLIGLTAGLVLTIGTIILNRYQNSQLHQEIFETHVSQSSSRAVYHNVTANISNNHFLANAPLIVIWAAIGLVVYYLTMAIIHMFGTAFEIRQELDYVNVTRSNLLKEALIQFGIRVVAVVVWFGFIKLSVAVIVPYALAAANSAGQGLNFANGLIAILAVAVIFITVYLHALLLRIIVLKPRLFGV